MACLDETGDYISATLADQPVYFRGILLNCLAYLLQKIDGLMSWSESRTVEAYKRLRDDVPVLADVWLADKDIVNLLLACYDFAGSGIELVSQNFNKATGRNGSMCLGVYFDSHPQSSAK